jgi:hypothetical protein
VRKPAKDHVAIHDSAALEPGATGGPIGTRRAALGVAASAAAGFLADKALSPEPAEATEGVISVNEKTGVVVLTAANVKALSETAVAGGATTATAGRTSLIAAPVLRDLYSVKDAPWSCVDDCKTATNAKISSGSLNKLTLESGEFVAADVGKSVGVVGAGPSGTAGLLLSTTISSVSGGVATLANAATSAVSKATCYYGTNNTSKLQEAVSAISAAGGGTILLPGGEYLTETIVPASNITLLGAGGTLRWATSNSKPGGTGVISNAAATEAFVNFRVENVTFVGAGREVGEANTERAAIKVWNGTGLRFIGCAIKGFANYGIGVVESEDVWWIDNEITECCLPKSNNAIGAQLKHVNTEPLRNCNDLIARGNIVKKCATSAISFSLQSTFEAPGSVRGIIEGNDVETNGGTFSPISLELGANGFGKTGNRITKVTIAGNHSTNGGEGTKSYGIQISDDATEGNHSSNSNAFFDIKVSDNVITSTVNGILCQGAHSSITGNVVEAQVNGITAEGSASATPPEVIVAANIVSLPSTGSVGLQVGKLEGVSVTGNRVSYAEGALSSNEGNGIQFSGTIAPTCQNNSVINAPRDGISYYECQDTLTQNCRVLNCNAGNHGSNGNGVALQKCEGGTFNIVQGCTLHDNRSTHQMYLCVSLTGTVVGFVEAGNVYAGWTYTSGPSNAPGVSTTVATQNNIVMSAASSFPTGLRSITVGSSPFTYENADPYAELVTVSGGTEVAIAFGHNSEETSLGVTAGMFYLQPGDKLIVTYKGTVVMHKAGLK